MQLLTHLVQVQASMAQLLPRPLVTLSVLCHVTKAENRATATRGPMMHGVTSASVVNLCRSAGERRFPWHCVRLSVQ